MTGGRSIGGAAGGRVPGAAGLAGPAGLAAVPVAGWTAGALALGTSLGSTIVLAGVVPAVGGAAFRGSSTAAS